MGVSHPFANFCDSVWYRRSAFPGSLVLRLD